jgi:hypothetical protein
VAARVGLRRRRVRPSRGLRGGREPDQRSFAEGAHPAEKERPSETSRIDDQGTESKHSITNQIRQETVAQEVRMQPSQDG